MTVTITGDSYVGSSLLVTFTSDLGPVPTPVFYVWRDDEQVGTTTEGSWEFEVAAGESPLISVFDVAGSEPGFAAAGRAWICWGAVANAAEYLIEEYVSSVWTERARVPDSGGSYYSWRTRYLEDCVVHQFRVTPVGGDGNEGTATVFPFLMVRTPDVGNWEGSFDSGTGKVTMTLG